MNSDTQEHTDEDTTQIEPLPLPYNGMVLVFMYDDGEMKLKISYPIYAYNTKHFFLCNNNQNRHTISAPISEGNSASDFIENSKEYPLYYYTADTGEKAPHLVLGIAQKDVTIKQEITVKYKGEEKKESFQLFTRWALNYTKDKILNSNEFTRLKYKKEELFPKLPIQGRRQRGIVIPLFMIPFLIKYAPDKIKKCLPSYKQISLQILDLLNFCGVNIIDNSLNIFFRNYHQIENNLIMALREEKNLTNRDRIETLSLKVKELESDRVKNESKKRKPMDNVEVEVSSDEGVSSSESSSSDEEEKKKEYEIANLVEETEIRNNKKPRKKFRFKIIENGSN
jgi:hypothetical protein